MQANKTDPSKRKAIDEFSLEAMPYFNHVILASKFQKNSGS